MTEDEEFTLDEFLSGAISEWLNEGEEVDQDRMEILREISADYEDVSRDMLTENLAPVIKVAMKNGYKLDDILDVLPLSAHMIYLGESGTDPNE